LLLSNFDHVRWESGAAVVAYFFEARPDLIDSLLVPAEGTMARSLSQKHQSWYRDGAILIRITRHLAPQSPQRILAQVSVTAAEVSWAAAISTAGPARRTAALLIESALERTDQVGDMARRLRSALPKIVWPQAEVLQPFPKTRVTSDLSAR
jgi:hypothetical protein